MYRTAVLAVVATAALTLSACASTTRNASADPTLPATSTATSTATATAAVAANPTRSSRGGIIKALGQEGAVCSDSACAGPFLLTFSIDKITADPACTAAYPRAPENGHFIAVDLRVSTSTAVDRSKGDAFSFSPNDFRVIGADGITRSNLSSPESFSCLPDSARFPQDVLGPGQQYAGTILLDSPAPSGVLILAPSFSGTSWEWQF